MMLLQKIGAVLPCTLLLACSIAGLAQSKTAVQKKSPVPQQEMTITGTIRPEPGNLVPDSVYLVYQYEANVGYLSAPVKNNAFSLRVPVLSHAMKATLATERVFYNDVRRFLVENGPAKITVTGVVRNTVVEAGPQNRMFDAYEGATGSIIDSMNTLRMRLSKKQLDSAAYKTAMAKQRADMEAARTKFVKEYPDSWISLDIMDEFVKAYLERQWAMDPEEIQLRRYREMLLSLKAPVREKADYLLVHLDNAENNRLIHFTGEMANGKTFDIASLKGRVFLIDFWGSWCHWCRKGHPHMKELYAKYKSKGFEIVGVGQEFGGTRAEKWKKFNDAIAQDGITWPQVLNDADKRDLTKEYLVRSYPSKFLVDQNGRIILRVGDDHDRLIDAKLKELLGEPAE